MSLNRGSTGASVIWSFCNAGSLYGKIS